MYSSPLFSTANYASMIYESTYNCISIQNAFWISNLAPSTPKRQSEEREGKCSNDFSEPGIRRGAVLRLTPVISITILLFLLGELTPKIHFIDLIAICSLELWEGWSEVGEDEWSMAVSQQEKCFVHSTAGVNMGFLINGCWVTWLHFPRPHRSYLI